MRFSPNQLRRFLVTLATIAIGLAVLVAALVIVGEQGMPARAGTSDTSAGATTTKSDAAGGSQAASTTALASQHGAPLDAYQGLASWVDLYDAKAWRNPEWAVSDMASHGVRTLFIETGNFHSPQPVMNADLLRRFIVAAHAKNMRIVAWYLPNMKPGSVDYARIMQAVQLRTADGQTFDSFALDIESSVISSPAMRNRSLEALSLKIRALVGPTYPLGAIIPSPMGLRKNHGVWSNFPYTMLAGIYDVFVPMGYYTYHGNSYASACTDAMGNVSIIRAQPGCSTVPIHLIGGIAENSRASQAQAFALAVHRSGCIGASLYGWAGTSPGEWAAMSTIGH